jgi:hypothetical protein
MLTARVDQFQQWCLTLYQKQVKKLSEDNSPHLQQHMPKLIFELVPHQYKYTDHSMPITKL